MHRNLPASSGKNKRKKTRLDVLPFDVFLLKGVFVEYFDCIQCS